MLRPSFPPRTNERESRSHMLLAYRLVRLIETHSDGLARSLQERYRNDKSCRNRPPGTSHTSVCKPKQAYQTPLTFIESGVINGQC